MLKKTDNNAPSPSNNFALSTVLTQKPTHDFNDLQLCKDSLNSSMSPHALQFGSSRMTNLPTANRGGAIVLGCAIGFFKIEVKAFASVTLYPTVVELCSSACLKTSQLAKPHTVVPVELIEENIARTVLEAEQTLYVLL